MNKKCSICREIKMIELFNKSKKGIIDGYCRVCRNNYSRNRDKLKKEFKLERPDNYKEIISDFINEKERLGYVELRDINLIITYFHQLFFTVSTGDDSQKAGVQLDYMYKKIKEKINKRHGNRR